MVNCTFFKEELQSKRPERFCHTFTPNSDYVTLLLHNENIEVWFNNGTVAAFKQFGRCDFIFLSRKRFQFFYSCLLW